MDDASLIPHFGSLFSSKAAVYGHCLATLPLAINETLKWLSSPPIIKHEMILAVTVYVNIQYNITLLPSVNTLIARGMFCGAKYTHHTVTPIIKHLITTTAATTTTTQSR